MTDQERQLAEFFATLANAEASVSGDSNSHDGRAPAGEKSRLARAWFLELKRALRPVLKTVRALPPDPRRFGSEPEKASWRRLDGVAAYLSIVQPQARRMLHTLLDGETAGGNLFDGQTMRLRLVGARVIEEWPTNPWHRLSALLHQVVRFDPFPFSRCPVCERIFVRSGRRRYCSRKCLSRVTEQRRQPRRREYMRQLMAKRRQRERAKRGRQEGR